MTTDEISSPKESEPIRGVVETTKPPGQQPNGAEKGGRHSSVRRCVSSDTRDFYEVAGSTVVVTLLILSPPIVLIGVILLTTGAIISKIFVLIAGLVTILSGVLVAAITAFVFVRMRGGGMSKQNSYKMAGAHGSSVRSRCSSARSGSGLGNYYRVTMDLERNTNSAEGSFRVEITEQPSTMVTFFSTADSDINPHESTKCNGSESDGCDESSPARSVRGDEVQIPAEDSTPCENG